MLPCTKAKEKNPNAYYYDANVVKFREVIGELEDKSQFIVITHNKKTMSFASQLYGITQREKGVSEVVSVQLNRSEQEQVEQSVRGN